MKESAGWGAMGGWGAGRCTEEIGEQDRVQWEEEQDGVQEKLGSRKECSRKLGSRRGCSGRLGSRRGAVGSWGARGGTEEVGKWEGVMKSLGRLCKEPHLAGGH